MTPRRFRIGSGPLLPALAVLWLLTPSAARAQAFRTTSEGLTAGHFVLHPSIAFEYTEDDNIFYRSGDSPFEDVTRSGILAMRPRLMVDLPIGAGRVRWIYSPVYRDYRSDSFSETRRFSHFFDFEFVRAGPVFTVRAVDHLVLGTIELQEVDRGGEAFFGFVPFTTHSPELEFAVKLGSRSGVSILPRYSSVTFDEQGEAAFFSYHRKEIEARFSRFLSEPTQLYGYYTFDTTDQEREQIVYGDVNLDARTVGAGLRRTLNREVVTSIAAGYKSIDFEGGSRSDFAGPVLEATTTWQISDAVQIDLRLGRQAYQSFFVNNNYFVDSEASVRLLYQLGYRTYLDVGVSHRSNDYADRLDISVTPDTEAGLDCDTTTTDPLGNTVCVGDGRIDDFESLEPSIGRRRRDRLSRFSLGVGWQPLRTLRLFIGYNGERRGSNIEQSSAGGNFEPFDYSVNRIMFRIEAGWL